MQCNWMWMHAIIINAVELFYSTIIPQIVNDFGYLANGGSSMKPIEWNTSNELRCSIVLRFVLFQYYFIIISYFIVEFSAHISKRKCDAHTNSNSSTQNFINLLHSNSKIAEKLSNLEMRIIINNFYLYLLMNIHFHLSGFPSNWNWFIQTLYWP